MAPDDSVWCIGKSTKTLERRASGPGVFERRPIGIVLGGHESSRSCRRVPRRHSRGICNEQAHDSDQRRFAPVTIRQRSLTGGGVRLALRAGGASAAISSPVALHADSASDVNIQREPAGRRAQMRLGQTCAARTSCIQTTSVTDVGTKPTVRTMRWAVVAVAAPTAGRSRTGSLCVTRRDRSARRMIQSRLPSISSSREHWISTPRNSSQTQPAWNGLQSLAGSNAQQMFSDRPSRVVRVRDAVVSGGARQPCAWRDTTRRMDENADAHRADRLARPT